jgi:hypothetical protein
MFRRTRSGRARARRASSNFFGGSARRRPMFELLEDRRLLAVMESEPNNSIATADVLGSEPFVTVNDAVILIAGDEDFYRYTAHHTGKLIVNAIFNDTPGDGVGDLDLQIQDSFGNPLDTSISVDSNEQVIIPVVAQQTYFIRVFGVGDDVNVYDLEVENFAAPAPSFIDLTSASDTGMSNTDNVTSDTTPTFLIQADLASFAGQDIDRIDQPVIDPDNNGIALDATDDGAGVYVSLINLTTGGQVQGFATRLGPTGILWSFTSPGLGNGEWMVSAAVQIVDGSDTNGIIAGTQRATGRAQLSDPLVITVNVGGAVAGMVSIDLIAASDSGVVTTDNVTNKMQPAFNGIAPAGSKIRLYVIANGSATQQLVGQTVAGSDSSDVGIGAIGGIGGGAADGLGLWEITVEPLADNGYDIRLEIEDAAGNVTQINPFLNAGLAPIVTDIVIDTLEPNTPLLDLIDDTGRHNNDNITKDNTPNVTMTSTDPNIALAQLLFTDNLIFRIFDRFNNNAEFLLYDSALDSALLGEAFETSNPADVFTSLTFILQNLPAQFFANPAPNTNNAVLDMAGVGVLADGIHNLKLEVEDRAGNFSHDFLLEITVDTVVPPVSFGLPGDPDDGLSPPTDSGIVTIPPTAADRITFDVTPRFWGRAEADTVVKLFLDFNNNGIIDLATDIFLGQTVALPFDGNDAYPDGYWEIETILDLNEIVGLPLDGPRSMLVTAEDVAGNPMPMGGQIIAPGLDVLPIFLDTQGPQVFDPDNGGPLQAIQVGGFPTFDLFDPKPSTLGYTPLVNSLVINVRDLPNRVTGFLYDALFEPLAEIEAHYSVVGDHVGAIDIVSALFIGDPLANGFPATGHIQLTFAAPLPDDRYTLVLSDELVDIAGNRLDGESGASEPDDDPDFPSGNGIAGGDFVARFTVDSRPEIGSFVSQHINLDINGNYFWDPASGLADDTTNDDLSFTLPAFLNGVAIPGNESPHELLVAGRFTAIGTNSPGVRFFDQLATYGNYNNVFRWLIDLDSDGAVFGNLDPDGSNDLIVNQAPIAGFNIAGAIPIAGDFDQNDNNGDEIGLYYSGKWAIDTNHDYIIDTVLSGNLFGAPIVGDFDGNGTDDFAVFNNNVFSFGFSLNPFVGASIVWGFPGVLDKPVAADMDQDGIDDIGLWVPRNSAGDNRIIAEWYFLVSNHFQVEDGIAVGNISHLNHPFSPAPFGFDIYAEFGDEMAMPIVGNFDPPVAAIPTVSVVNTQAGDYNGDDVVDGDDYLVWKSSYRSTTHLEADGNGDGVVDSLDYTIWRNNVGHVMGSGSGGLASGTQQALVAETSVAADESEPAAESSSLFAPLAVSSTSGSSASDTFVGPLRSSDVEDDALLLVLADQPALASSANGDDSEFESWLAESASDEAEVSGDLALATAWQVWDEL